MMSMLPRPMVSFALLLTWIALVPPPAWAADRFVAEGPALDSLEARRVLLQVRRQELDSADRQGVVDDVRRRAEEFEIKVPIDVLVDMLTQRAWLALDLEECLVEGGGCSGLEADLGVLEASFVERVGFTMAEFRRGQLDAARTSGAAGLPLQSLVAKGLFPPPSGSSRTDPQYCSCSFSLSSKDRWVSRWWGLECNNHGAHGVCSGNVDSAHSAGAGAMTGTIEMFFGSQQRRLDCQDDHRTCFRGPISTSKPGGGHWTNVCSCDTFHSQFSNPSASFYGGDLTDSTIVQQAGFSASADGSCAETSVAVFEGIEEHDPFCCDDPMGTLSAFAFLSEGFSFHEIPTSATNCNGGSQSGLPPYCGSFGATIRIAATCQTQNDDDFGSCYGKCGELLHDATCNCDFECQQYGDCCDDYCSSCASAPGQSPFPCGSQPGGGDY